MVPAPPPMNQNQLQSTAKLNLVGGDSSRTWNLVWLFGGLAFAGYVVSIVPRHIRQMQDAQRAAGWAGLTAQEVRNADLGHVAKHATRKTYMFLQDMRVTPRQLHDAVRSVSALNVAGTGLPEMLAEFLTGAGDGLDAADSNLTYGAVEGALKAVLLTAERLATVSS